MKNPHVPSENANNTLHNIRTLIADDLSAFNNAIHTELASSVPLTREITQHIFQTKGKQLRPLLVILSARAFLPSNPLQKRHLEIAIVIEFVHTATLLHDDVVDHSLLRRGQQTANAIWGNAASVLVGDFLYSRAFQILARNHNPQIMHILSETTNAIAEGEVMQLMNQHDADLSEENYFHVITQKTAKLFSAAAEIGALLHPGEKRGQSAMAAYGLHLGITFQMIDDLLDYETSAEVTGKNIGDDLAEGKVTYPLIFAMKHTTPEKAALIQNAIRHGDVSALPDVVSILEETKAFTATRNKALEHAAYAKQALTVIPASPYRQAMEELVGFAVQRVY